jgi:hypothetical protein
VSGAQSLCGSSEHHRLRIGEPGCQRLLQIDVLACLDDLQVHRRMGGGNGEVHHDLNGGVSEQCVDGRRIHGVLSSLCACRIGANVGHRLHTHQLRLRRTTKIGVADIAAADDADGRRFHTA